jgi:hypothetical protein
MRGASLISAPVSKPVCTRVRVCARREPIVRIGSNVLGSMVS